MPNPSSVEGLKPYPSYRETRLPWLDRMPAHWSLRRGKTLFQCINVRSDLGEEQLLTVSSERGVIPRRTATVTMFKAESYSGYKLCWPGDLVINSLWAWASGLAVSQHHGIVSTAYGVYRLLNRDENVPSFIHELVRSLPFQWELQVRSKGIWTSRLQLTDGMFLDAPFPTPPPEEQFAIVRFLDYADQRIRLYMRAKQKLIKLLEEQKQAIIHRAVTGQIDVRTGKHYPAYKPSRVEWMGDVPGHWDARRIRTCLTDTRAGIWGDDPTPGNTVDHVVCLRVADFDMRRLRVSPNKLTVRAVPAAARALRLLAPGDILMEKSGGGEAEPVGRVVLYDGQVASHAISSNFIVRLRPDASSVVPKFLLLVLAAMQSTRRNVPWIKQTTGIQNLDERAYLSLSIGVPPIEEQRQILAQLSSMLRPVEQGIERSGREIVLLREYRTRLIADVVTGKLDVRGAAMQLPDEAEEQEGVEDAEEPTEEGNETVDAGIEAISEETEG